MTFLPALCLDVGQNMEVFLLWDVGELLRGIEEDEAGLAYHFFTGDLDAGELCFPVGRIIDINPLNHILDLLIWQHIIAIIRPEKAMIIAP